jgi:uncharacterized protein (TIGR03437 family)
MLRNSVVCRPTFALFVLIAPAVAQIPRQIRTIEMDGREISYVIDGPFAVTQGDIILGKASEIESWRIARERGTAGPAPQSLHEAFGSTGPQPWPNGIIYYAIDPSVTNPQPILDGIAQWNSRTPLQVLPFTGQPNYVVFVNTPIVDAACESYIGMAGGAQFIPVTSACTAGAVAHELGHAFGLWHEHERLDRGGYVTVLYENIDKRFYSAFWQNPSLTASSGYYDFGSIMHYPWYGFSNNLQDTLETVPVGIPIGQLNGLSAGDIDGASRLYGFVPSTTTITTVPEGLPITVDGVAAVSPQSYNWGPGTQHTVGVESVQGIEPRYVFANWSDGGDATHTLTASADQTVFCANFVVEHVVSVSSLGGGTASISPVPTGGYLAERYPFELSATPAPGFQFLGWEELGQELPFYGASVNAPSAAFEVLQTSYQPFAATFTNAPITTIDSQPRGLQLAVDGVVVTTPLNFTWAAGSTHTLAAVATEQYSRSGAAQYLFLNWDDGSTGTRTVTAGANGGTYTALFNTQYLLSIGYVGSGLVTASPASADGFYDAGTTVQLTASTPSGVLRYWGVDLSGNQNPATIVMDQQRFVGANFGPPFPFRVLSAASFTGNPNPGTAGTTVAPGELVAIFGSGIGPATATAGSVDSSGTFPFSLAGYQVFFDSYPAPLIYAGPNQINAIVPYGVAGESGTTVKITGPSGPLTLGISVGDTAPSLFTSGESGTGGLAALNQDTTINSPSNPAAKGSVVVLFGSGGGAMDMQFADGLVTGTDLGRITAPVWVRFGKLPGTVYYAGSAPAEVNGVFQINVAIPNDLAVGGQVPVQVIIGSFASPPGTTISVQ